MKKTKKPIKPWEQPNKYGDLPGGLCCMRSVGGKCFEHNPVNYLNYKKTQEKDKLEIALQKSLELLGSLSELTSSVEQIKTIIKASEVYNKLKSMRKYYE